MSFLKHKLRQTQISVRHLGQCTVLGVVLEGNVLRCII